jgi:hypothetical protein
MGKNYPTLGHKIIKITKNRNSFVDVLAITIFYEITKKTTITTQKFVVTVTKTFLYTLIKKIKFSSNTRKFSMEQLQSHI